MCIFLLFLFYHVDSDFLEQQQKQTSASSNLPIKVYAEKSQKSRTDLQRKQTFNYETLFPDFYYSFCQNGWFYKICPNFAPGSGVESW